MQFEQTDHISPDLIGLFENTVLGTNGAKYKHLDVAQSVSHTDYPLSFSLRRREQLIANITFCKRPFGLYLRYFAFDKRFQSKGKARMNPKSQIKKEIENVFKDITARYPGSQAYCYAYIDAKNIRSKWIGCSLVKFDFVSRYKRRTFNFLSFNQSRQLTKRHGFCNIFSLSNFLQRKGESGILSRTIHQLSLREFIIFLVIILYGPTIGSRDTFNGSGSKKINGLIFLIPLLNGQVVNLIF